MKSEKAVTLIILVITIVVLIILTFTLTINMDKYGNKRRKTNFETDLQRLKEQVDQYYATNDKLPIINPYGTTSMLKEFINVNDNEHYYVIDISKLNVVLNYGEDYNIIKEKNIKEEITDLLDVYIINEQSHTIYYPKGIKYDGIYHYTSNEVYNDIKIEGYVNKPKLAEGMTPIKFTMPTSTAEGTVIETKESDENWYQYGTTYETRKWANAKTADGSMWVWIPRYAYKITYYTDETKEVKSATKTEYGDIDVVFLIGTTDNYYDENGAIKTAKRATSESVKEDGNYYVHPAFTDESNIGYANGGWDEELTGIWVAKFEAGKEETQYPTFQANKTSFTNISVGEAFEICKGLTNTGNPYKFSHKVDSHLMKNSEWGACAYLSRSIYGINGEVWNNPYHDAENSTITGLCGKGETDKDLSTTNINDTCKYNEINGGNASTTGNIYGIYDMVGGGWDYVAGILSSYKTKSDNYDFNNSATYPDKYFDWYAGDSNDRDANYNENTNKYGDAVYETSKSGTSISTSWDSSYSYFTFSNNPVFGRGGHASNGSSAGVFAFSNFTGGARSDNSFRPVVLSAKP